MTKRSIMMWVLLLATGLLGVRTAALAECDDVDRQVPFHRTPMEDRTLGQIIQTRKFQIECMNSFIKKIRDSRAPENAWRNPCDNTRCKKVFDRCNRAAADVAKYPICDGNDCRVENGGSDDYCFDAFKKSFGFERTDCYQFVLGELDKATIGKCWKVQRELAAERAEARMDRYNAEIQALELRIAQGADRDSKDLVKKDEDASAGKDAKLRHDRDPNTVKAERGHEKAE